MAYKLLPQRPLSIYFGPRIIASTGTPTNTEVFTCGVNDQMVMAFPSLSPSQFSPSIYSWQHQVQWTTSPSPAFKVAATWNAIICYPIVQWNHLIWYPMSIPRHCFSFKMVLLKAA